MLAPAPIAAVFRVGVHSVAKAGPRVILAALAALTAVGLGLIHPLGLA